MDKIGRPSPAALLSQQVTGARYFFLHLAPPRGRTATLALGGRETCNPDYAIQRARYPYAGIEYVAEGRGWVELDGRRQTLEPGAVFSYGRDTRCAIGTDPAAPMVKYFACLAGRDAGGRLREAGLPLGSLRRVAAHGELRTRWEDLIREGQHAGEAARGICAALLEVLLLKLEQGTSHRHARNEPAREMFLRCKALIDGQAERLTSLREVAAHAGLEASSLCRLFRRYHGTSPYQYLLRRKMNAAAEYLVESGGLVKEAGLRVGFTDPYHFSRCFKAVHGVSPRDVRHYRRTG